MSVEDNTTATPPPKARGPTKRGHLLLGAIAVLVVTALLIAAVTTRDDKEAAGASPTEPSPVPTSARSTTATNLRTELVSRLREILRMREDAYHRRDPGVLKDIYTVDCPCLKSDSNAIRELLAKRYVWVGGTTTIQVRRLERVSNQQWIIIATFTSESLRIETESGSLVRSEPRGTELFQFVLAMPPDSEQWLLGRASFYKDG
jgi:hypothetical protein